MTGKVLNNMAYYQITKLIFQFTKITNMNYLDSFIRLVSNGFNLNVLAKRLAADPKITWSPNFKNNPMLMAHIQAGLLANVLKPQQQNVVEKPEPY